MVSVITATEPESQHRLICAAAAAVRLMQDEKFGSPSCDH